MRMFPVVLLMLALPASALPPQAANPLLQAWTTPFQVPPFDQIRAEHFLPAFREAFARQKAELAAVAKNPAAPGFANTIEAIDDSGELLARVRNVFSTLTDAETSEALQALNGQIAPMLAAHFDDLLLDPALFVRVKAVFDGRAGLQLNAEQRTLLERTYRAFLRGGAGLPAEKQARLRTVNAELAGLQVTFGDNVLKATNAYRLVVDRKEDLAGLPEGQVIAAAEAAKSAGLGGKWVFTLKGTSLNPFLGHAANRELRRQLFLANAARCEAGPEDNRGVFARIAALRAEKAQLLGFATWAHFMLAENMAKEPAGAYRLLEQLWQPALEVAKQDRAALQAMMDQEQPGRKLEAWDWRYYENQVRRARYDLDESALRPYFPLARVRDGAFQLAGRLYGLTFTERKDLPTYHPEVQTFEVKEKDGKHLGLLYVDYHPRPGKRSGAWCTNLVDQWVKDGRDIRPVVTNVGNFSRPAGDAPALLTPGEVRTLFHEFGHALHFLLSSVRFRGSANVAIDFVEMPSQILENWAFEPEVLKTYARHHRTGEVMPAALLDKLQKGGRFGQGFGTTEYLAACLLDLDWHTLADAKPRDATAFEQASMARWGLLPEILPRYRTPVFNHAATDYSAGYYSYIWSAVLDSDAFRAFKEKGDLYDPAAARALRTLLSKVGSEDPAALYRAFRGRDPKVEALLEKRGLK